jgi:hypothetical protein
MKLYAVIDPGWGEPHPVLETIRATADESWEAAEWCQSLALYSGASAYPLPRGTKGNKQNLLRVGYVMGQIDVEITHPKPKS